MTTATLLVIKLSVFKCAPTTALANLNGLLLLSPILKTPEPALLSQARKLLNCFGQGRTQAEVAH